MSSLNKILHFFILPCSKATFLIEKRMNTRLSFFEWTQLEAHLILCKWCKVYEKKADFLHQIVGGGFGNTLLSSEIYKEKTDNGIIGLKYRQDSKRSFIAGILLLSIVIIAVIGLMRKNKKVVYLSSLCLLFNILLHCVFGRSEIHLYAQHYLFLILFIIGYSISKIESIEIRRVIAALIFLVLMYI